MSGQENETAQAEEVTNNDETAQRQQATENNAEQQIDNESATNASDELEKLQNALQKEQEQSQAHLETALRAQAEMENLRKRTTRDIENAHKYALEKFVSELLPIMDSMELGMSAADSAESTAQLKEGMELTLNMFTSALEKFGVKQVSPEGEKFNPELHEAVSAQEIEGKPSGTVVTVMQKGYELNGRLVRPAMVMEAK